MEIKNFDSFSESENRVLIKDLIEIDRVCFGDVAVEDEGKHFLSNFNPEIVGHDNEDRDIYLIKKLS